MQEQFYALLREGVDALTEWPDRTVRVFHHNDTDGLTSGAILSAALGRAGFRVLRFALEKPYPQLLRRILASRNGIVVFADFAGRIAPLISELNAERNLVLILDLHPAEPSTGRRVLNLDGDLCGLKGDRDVSASATCALFAEVLDPANRALAHLGALGAIGDQFFVDGALSALNRVMLERAVSQGRMQVSKHESGEDYSVVLGGTTYAARDICGMLDTLGGAGYYEGGADVGIEICSHGVEAASVRTVERLRKIQDVRFEREIERLRAGALHTTEHLQWFDVEERFAPMGVKMIGVFCQKVRNMEFVDPSKYLAGFQTVPDEVPGFGAVEMGAKKISMRVSAELTEKIRSGAAPGLSDFLAEATLNIGGFADACHGLSAATTVRIGQEAALIGEAERVLTRLLQGATDGHR